MRTETAKEKYPILSLRIKPEQMAYLRRESEEKKMNLPNYVRTILFPFPISDDKK